MRFAALLASGPLALPNPAAASATYRSQRSLLSDAGYSRHLQEYTDEFCTAAVSAMATVDADSSGGISQDEFYSALAAMGDESLGGSFDDLPLVYKVVHKSLACYCAVLGGGEDCCVGEDAEVPVYVFEDEGFVSDGTAEQYRDEVCSTLAWATETVAAGVGVDPAETETETTAAPDDAETETTAAPDDAPEAGELPVATEAPSDDTPAAEPAVELASDGTMTFEVYASVIDFAAYGADQPETYENYYDAEAVLADADDNGILEDMQKGFVALALAEFQALDADAESDDTPAEASAADATTEAPESDDTPAATEAPGRKLRGTAPRLLAVRRTLQDISFLIGGNLTTEVEDAECPASLTYAPEGAPCLEFKYSIKPPETALEYTDMLTAFANQMASSIAEGNLTAKVLEINPGTLVKGSGSPGGTGESFDAQYGTGASSDPSGAEAEDTNKDADGGGLSTGAIIGIIIAVLAVPMAYLAYRSMNKKEEQPVQSRAAPISSFSPAPLGSSSDDEIAGTATRVATAVANKPDSSTKLGFTYKMYADQIVVASVKEGGIFEGTPLKAGNEIISINGHEVKGMDRDSFRSLLANLPEGNITIVMNETVPLTILRVAAHKPEPTSKLGFTYKFIGNQIVVASVKDDGIFADTELKKGQEIVSINSRRVAGMNKDQFRGMLQSLPQGKVMITVKDIVEFSILKIVTSKPAPESKLGFMYKVLDDGIVVASVNDSGIFADTALAKGQEIVSVNQKNVQKMTKEAFRAYLSTIPAGDVTFIVVDKPKKWAKSGTTLTCTAVKESDDSKLGFTYKVMKDGAVIESVGEYGIFASTDLAQGQEVVTVNGTPVAGMDRMEFRDLLSGLKAGPVEIVVVDRSSKWDTKGEIVVVEAVKETETTKLGFTYKVQKNMVTVESVKPEGIFGNTLLAKGQEIMSINGTNVRGFGRDEFRELLTSLPAGTIRIIVSDSFKSLVSKGGIISVTANKVADDTKLGFTYKVLRDTITIESVKEEGIFGGTELAPGQKVVRINGTSVKGLDRTAFRELLGKLTAGPVTLDVFDEGRKSMDVFAAAPQATVEEEAKEEEQPMVEVLSEEEIDRLSTVAVVPEELVVADVPEEIRSPEEDAQLEEIKKEVRILVEQATPGKSADEMLAQYEGREDELLSHLRKFVARNQ